MTSDVSFTTYSNYMQFSMFAAGMWKRKRKLEAVEAVNFCGSRSILMKEAGSGSELRSESVEKELEAEAIF